MAKYLFQERKVTFGRDNTWTSLQMASAYSHCAVGVVSAAVFAVSPAISASHRFDCVLFTITQNSVGGAVLALGEPIIHVGKSSQEGWEGEPLTSWPGLQPQGSKILSGKAYLGRAPWYTLSINININNNNNKNKNIY